MRVFQGIVNTLAGCEGFVPEDMAEVIVPSIIPGIGKEPYSIPNKRTSQVEGIILPRIPARRFLESKSIESLFADQGLLHVFVVVLDGRAAVKFISARPRHNVHESPISMCDLGRMAEKLHLDFFIDIDVDIDEERHG